MSRIELKFLQIAVTHNDFERNTLFAVADDGHIYRFDDCHNDWLRLPIGYVVPTDMNGENLK